MRYDFRSVTAARPRTVYVVEAIGKSTMTGAWRGQRLCAGLPHRWWPVFKVGSVCIRCMRVASRLELGEVRRG